MSADHPNRQVQRANLCANQPPVINARRKCNKAYALCGQHRPTTSKRHGSGDPQHYGHRSLDRGAQLRATSAWDRTVCTRRVHVKRLCTAKASATRRATGRVRSSREAPLVQASSHQQRFVEKKKFLTNRSGSDYQLLYINSSAYHRAALWRAQDERLRLIYIIQQCVSVYRLMVMKVLSVRSQALPFKAGRTPL